MDRPHYFTSRVQTRWHRGGVLLAALALLLPLPSYAGDAVLVGPAPETSPASAASAEVQVVEPFLLVQEAPSAAQDSSADLLAGALAGNLATLGDPPPVLLLRSAVAAAIAESPGLGALQWQAYAQWEQALSVQGRGGLSSELSLLGMQTNSPLGVFASRLSQGRVTPADFDPAALNDPDFLGNVEYKLKLQYPLFTSQRIELLAEALKLNSEAVDFDRLAAEHQLTARVIELYFAHDLLGRQLQVLDDAKLTIDELKRLIESLEAEGLALKADVAAADVEAANLASEINTAQQNLALTENVLNLLMGQPAASFVSRIEVTPAQVSVPSLDEALAAALAGRADLQALNRRVCAAANMLDETIRQRNPSVGAFAEVKHSSPGLPGDGHSEATVGAQLLLDLDTGSVIRHSIEQKRAELQAAQLGLQQLEQTAQIEVAQAHSALLTAQGAQQLFAAQSGKSAENLRVVRNRYREGLTNFLDLRMAVTTHKESRLRELNSEYDYLLAYMRLLSATGQLGGADDPFLAQAGAGSDEQPATDAVDAAKEGESDVN